MSSRRQVKIAEEMAHLAANFFARESNAQSLITVTRADVASNLKSVMILFTVLPEKFEESALTFAKRNRTDFREYLKSHSSFQRIPTVDFEIDHGEKNRQRIDDLTRK
ncbi:ribosome-binding factor A [Candidatus Parcubacteria bacterium]|nr:MAG: ribosome-binding factor A [Candidatus Parcubacteria bacterium]